MFCEIQILTSGGYFSWYVIYKFVDAFVLVIFLVKKKKRNNKTVKTSKQKAKARISCLLRMKLEDVGVYLEFLWDRECRGRAVRYSRSWV